MNMREKNAGCTDNYPPVPSAAAGFGYLGLLLIIAIMGVVLVSTVQVWHMEMQRAKEQELLFVGDQFRRAINQYARHAQPGSLRFPMSLEDLLKDPRYPDTQRYLRKIYDDPISGSSKWGLLKGQSGEIFGIYSLSEEEPVKKHNFSLADASFEDRKKYSDWVFMSTPMRYGSRPSRKP